MPTIKGLKEVTLIVGKDHTTTLVHAKSLQELQALLVQVCLAPCGGGGASRAACRGEACEARSCQQEPE